MSLDYTKGRGSAYSIQREVSDGSLSRVLVRIPYFNKTDIKVSIDNKEVGAHSGDTEYSYTWDGKYIVITPVVANESVVLIRRTTELDHAINIFDGQAEFTDESMDENFRQLIYLAQEFTEGSGFKDAYQDVNMHGFKIQNNGPATEPNDLVTYQQFLTGAHGIEQDRIRAEAAADRADLSAAKAQTSAGIAVSASTQSVDILNENIRAADIVKAQATQVARDKDTASVLAGRAEDSARFAQLYSDSAHEASEQAQSYANNAKTSETNAKKSETNAKASEDAAKSTADSIPAQAQVEIAKVKAEGDTQFNRLKPEADRAMGSADRAETAEANAKTSETNAKTSEANAAKDAKQTALDAVQTGKDAKKTGEDLLALQRQLKDYLPKTGGDITGSLTVNGKALATADELKGYLPEENPSAVGSFTLNEAKLVATKNVLNLKGKGNSYTAGFSSDLNYGVASLVVEDDNDHSRDVSLLTSAYGVEFKKSGVKNPLLHTGSQSFSEAQQVQVCSNIGARHVHAQGDGWIQYEDGTQECWGALTFQSGEFITDVSGFVATPTLSLIFPVPFNTVPVVSLQNSGAVSWVFLSFGKSEVAIGKATIWRANSLSARELTASYIAKGRWK